MQAEDAAGFAQANSPAPADPSQTKHNITSAVIEYKGLSRMRNKNMNCKPADSLLIFCTRGIHFSAWPTFPNFMLSAESLATCAGVAVCGGSLRLSIRKGKGSFECLSILAAGYSRVSIR